MKIQNLLTHDVTLQVFRVIIAIVFLAAAIPKAMHFDNTVLTITQYDIFEYTASTMLAYLLITAEVIIAIFMILGLGIRLGAGLSAFLLCVFIVGIAQAWARGISLDCGCFGVTNVEDLGSVLTPWYEYAWIIVRDIGLLFMSMVLCWYGGGVKYSVDRVIGRRRTVSSSS